MPSLPQSCGLWENRVEPGLNAEVDGQGCLDRGCVPEAEAKTTLHAMGSLPPPLLMAPGPDETLGCAHVHACVITPLHLGVLVFCLCPPSFTSSRTPVTMTVPRVPGDGMGLDGRWRTPLQILGRHAKRSHHIGREEAERRRNGKEEEGRNWWSVEDAQPIPIHTGPAPNLHLQSSLCFPQSTPNTQRCAAPGSVVATKKI
ncbi:hypothetical protein B0I35DRAFT_17529 [Stachybotrys elegans]|uniref:Uncharacterized protein n=1 Tax=Stachybotrys elegans TaxID=80388 RepID=A0A8K0WWQ0_9HYPO|nr:hypothetical protein B0I35DRAFT_17529 [Stachybotrys elegans]